MVGPCSLPTFPHTSAQRDPGSLGSPQPQQGSEVLQMHHAWPSAPAATQGLTLCGRRRLQCRVCSGERSDHILWLLCFPFSYFMWSCEAMTARAAVPTSPPCAIPLRQTHCVSPGQRQGSDRNPGTRRGVSLPRGHHQHRV